MNILVTGGSGFIGSNLVSTLLQYGNKVFATGRYDRVGLIGETENLIRLPYGTYGVDWGYLKSTGENIDILFHLSANNDTTCQNYNEMEFCNVVSSLNIFDIAYNLGCRKIVYASSTAVYGNTVPPYKENGPTDPLNQYAKSKLMLEAASTIASESYKIPIIGLRYCNVYGPGEAHKNKRASMVYQMASQMRRRPPKLFCCGEQKRDYIFIDDIVTLTILASQLDSSVIINCGTGYSTTYNELFDILKTHIKCNWDKPEYIENPYIDSFQNHTQCDIDLADKLLNFKPKYDIKSGIAEYALRGSLG